MYNFEKWYVNTIIMTSLCIIIKIFFVSFTAYGFSKINFKGRDVIFHWISVMIMTMTNITNAIALARLVSYFMNAVRTILTLITVVACPGPPSVNAWIMVKFCKELLW